MSAHFKLALDAAGIRKLVQRTIRRNELLGLRIAVDPETLQATVASSSITLLDGVSAESISELFYALAYFLDPSKNAENPAICDEPKKL